MLDRILAAVACVVAIGATAIAWKNRPLKIGYAETSVLLTDFTEAIHARKQYEEAQKDWDKNLNQINDSLVSAMGRMKSGYDKATNKEREEMKENLNRWNSDLQKYTNAVKKMAEEKEKALMDPVLNKMNSYMKVWGEQHGYDMIFGTMNGGNILQAKSALNVTSNLLADLNLQYRDLPTGKSESPKEDLPNGVRDSTKEKASK